MRPKRRLLSRLLHSESFLIGILCLIGLIPWPTPAKKLGRPYVYSPIVMLRCFIVRMWMKIPSNSALHSFFLLSTQNPYNARIMMACGLHRIPDRRTFDRRLKSISTDGSDEDLRPRIDAMYGSPVRRRGAGRPIHRLRRQHAPQSEGRDMAQEEHGEGHRPSSLDRHRGEVGQEQDQGVGLRL